MTLEALANIGEIIGALGVIVSLLYVAAQVRQNTAAQHMETYAQAVDRIGRLQAEVSRDDELLRAWSRGMQDPDSLTPVQRLRMNWSLYAAFGDMEFLYVAARKSSLPDEIWERWSATLDWWVAMPGVQAWWSSLPTRFERSFTEHIDAAIAAKRADAAAMERFNNFIAHGTRIPADAD